MHSERRRLVSSLKPDVKLEAARVKFNVHIILCNREREKGGEGGSASHKPEDFINHRQSGHFL